MSTSGWQNLPGGALSEVAFFQGVTDLTVIRQSSGVCTVIVTVDANLAIMPELEAHARYGLARFRELRGLVSGACHRSADGTCLAQHLQWETEADHLACVQHPQWDEIPSTRRFMELVDSGQATIDVRIYDVVASNEA